MLGDSFSFLRVIFHYHIGYFFVTKFVTHITKFVIRVTKFVTHVRKFVTKNICADSKKNQGDSEKYQGANKNSLRRQFFLSAQRVETIYRSVDAVI